MMTNMKRLLLLCTFLITFNSFPDTFSDSVAAYERGDYTSTITLFEKLAEQGDREYEEFLRVRVLEDCFTCQ